MAVHLLLPKTRTHYNLGDLVSPPPNADTAVTHRVTQQINALIELLNQAIKDHHLLDSVSTTRRIRISTTLTRLQISPHRLCFHVLVYAANSKTRDTMLFIVSKQDPNLKLVRCWVDPSVITQMVHNLINEWPS